MERKGPSPFPITGQENLCFSELPRRRSRSRAPTQSDEEIAEMRKDLLTSWKSEKKDRRSQRQRESRNDGPLEDLVNQVADIIPQSRIDLPSETPRNNTIEREIKESLFDNLAALSALDKSLNKDHSQTEELIRKEKQDLALTRERLDQLAMQRQEIEQVPQAEASEEDLRNTMRPPIGPDDLRNSHLNAKKDLRNTMRPPKGPDDLRNCHLNAQEV